MAKNTMVYVFMAFLLSFTVFLSCTEEGADNFSEGTDMNAPGVVSMTDNPIPEPGTFPGLDAETERRIIQEYYDLLNNHNLSNNSSNPYFNPDYYVIDDFYIMYYYGTYNGAVAVMMGHKQAMYGMIITRVTVAGITFTYGDTNSISVWKEGLFYTLQSAYDFGLLTRDDLESISNWYPKGNN
ncbi:MAG: hypothetical protein FWD36_08205 [Treponema sp.]|nr:hypothetical protein [Treponema sp.]